MLSLAHVSAQHGANYYKMENYYSEKDSVGFSKWVGNDADKNDLRGSVEPEKFGALLRGDDAKIGVAGNLQNRKRAALDLTFSAPKSVSIQALVFGDDRLVLAHREAVNEAFSFAENNYAHYRAGGRSSRVVLLGKGFLAAQFEHDSSRLKDPQLHTHNVVFNRIETEKGEIRALHGDNIYKNSVFLGMVYQNSLALKVQELGYNMRPNSKGMFEIEGYSREQLEVFSKRTKQIEELNPEDFKEKREFVLKNRKSKGGAQNREQLVSNWQLEAAKYGIESLTASPRNLEKNRSNDHFKLLQQAVASVTTKNAVFRKEDVLKEALQMSLGKCSISELEIVFKQIQKTNFLHTRKQDFFTTHEAVKRDLEIRKFIENGREKYEPISPLESIEVRVREMQRLNTDSAREALEKNKIHLYKLGFSEENADSVLNRFERASILGRRIPIAEITKAREEIFEILKAQNLKVSGRVFATQVSEVMKPLEKSFLAPTTGQLEAVEQTLFCKDKYIVWQGVAGAGKTFAIRHAIEEAKSAGFDVKGFAPSAAAALQLSKETGIEAETLQSHVLKRVQSVSQKALWIVDEAGMVSAHDFYALQKKAEREGARVLLVGDSRQLTPVDAGNPFLDIQKNTGVLVLNLKESLRQKDAILQKVVKEFYEGSVSEGLKKIEGRILEKSTSHGRINTTAREFVKGFVREKKTEGTPENTLLLTRTNKSREELTLKIRSELKKQGFLTNETNVSVLKRSDIPEQRLAFASSFQEGSFLVPNKNYKKLGLEREIPYEIVSRNFQNNTVKVKSANSVLEISLEKNHQFSLYKKKALELAEGDKMVFTKNSKSRNETNNEGFVVERISKNGIHILTEAGKRKTLEKSGLLHIEHAWALTVYKAQGQTADRVLQLVDSGTTKRDLLVGITRAREDVMLVGKSKGEVLKSAEKDTQKHIAVEEVLSLHKVLDKNNSVRVGIRR